MTVNLTFSNAYMFVCLLIIAYLTLCYWFWTVNTPPFIICILGALLVSIIVSVFNVKDLGYIDGYSKNMYLEGSKLYVEIGGKSDMVIQPNGIQKKVDRVEENIDQNEVLQNDDSDIVYLTDCVKEINILGLLKIRYTYNILYLDDMTYKQYLIFHNDEILDGKNISGYQLIALDNWISEDDKLFDEQGNLKE